MGKDSIKDDITSVEEDIRVQKQHVGKAKNNFFKFNTTLAFQGHRNSLPNARYDPKQSSKKLSPRKNSLRGSYFNPNYMVYPRENKENSFPRDTMGEEQVYSDKKINPQLTFSLAKLLAQNAEHDEPFIPLGEGLEGEEKGRKEEQGVHKPSFVSIAEVEPLLSFGASTKLKLEGYRGCTLLHIACGFLNPDVPPNVPLLSRLLREADVEDLVLLNEEGYNVFHWAVEKEKKEILSCLVERLSQEKPKTVHSIINEKAGAHLYNRTPLHLAALTHNEEIIRILISNNADGNIRDVNNQTSFELALLSEASQSVLDLLMETTKVIKVMKKCLNNFSIRDCRNVILKLARMGMNFKLRNRKNNTPMMISSQFGDVELLKELVELAKQHKTEGLEALDDNFHTALHFSCSWGHFECVRLLLDAGANIEATDNQGNTPLCRAAQWNRADVCKLLLERGANANAVSSFNKTPLELAFVKGLNNCENPHWDVIQVLLPYTDISKLLFRNDSSNEKIAFYAR